METQKREIPLEVALPLANRITRQLARHPDVQQIQVAGSLRRREDVVGDIDILVGVTNRSEAPYIFEEICEWKAVDEILKSGPTQLSVLVNEDIQVDFITSEMDVYGAALIHFTGPAEHNISLRQEAKQMGFKLSQHGLVEEDKARETERLVAGKTENDVYDALGLRRPKPEHRSGEL